MVRSIQSNERPHLEPNRIAGLAATIAVNVAFLMLLLVPLRTPSLPPLPTPGTVIQWIIPEPVKPVEPIRVPITKPHPVTRPTHAPRQAAVPHQDDPGDQRFGDAHPGEQRAGRRASRRQRRANVEPQVGMSLAIRHGASAHLSSRCIARRRPGHGAVAGAGGRRRPAAARRRAAQQRRSPTRRRRTPPGARPLALPAGDAGRARGAGDRPGAVEFKLGGSSCRRGAASRLAPLALRAVIRMVRQQAGCPIQLFGDHQPHQHVRQRERAQRPALVGARRPRRRHGLRDRRSGTRGHGRAHASAPAAAPAARTSTACRGPSSSDHVRVFRQGREHAAAFVVDRPRGDRGPCRAIRARSRQFQWQPVRKALAVFGESRRRPTPARVRQRRSGGLSSAAVAAWFDLDRLRPRSR